MNDKGSNKYQLRLPSLSIRRSEQLQENPSEEEGLLLNILPSYQMYQSTISKNLTPTTEDPRTDPPSYELTPQTSVTSGGSSVNDYFAGISLPTSPTPEPATTVSESNFTRWDDTILANAHKLKRLTSTNKELSNCLSIQIKLTEHIGKIGVKPKIIDPLSLELKQGDYIYGFILVTNKTDQDIPFDMLSVVLEGALTFGNNNNTVVQPPSHIVKFLTMFDFNASWNDACLDRLVTDNNNPYVPLINSVDPFDNTHVQLDSRKIFEPKVTYKKFFTFKMPEKLLDSSCEPHGLVKHLQIPPTLGISKNEVISCLRRKWKDNKGNDGDISAPKTEDFLKHDRIENKYAALTNDFSFFDTSISYSISARIIGKASNYEHLLIKNPPPHLNPNADEYVVVNEDYCYLRVIPSTNEVFELNRSMINEEAKLIYSNMIDKVNEKIALGKELSNLRSEDRNYSTPLLHPTTSTIELAKMQQSYYSKVKECSHNSYRDDVYEVFLPYKKKSIFGASKIVGLTALSTPRREYRVSYVPLPGFRQPNETMPSTKLSIPMDLTFILSEKSSVMLPDFKKISVELVSLSIKSKNLPIPVAFHHDMLFENKSKGPDNFDYLTVKTFQKYAIELHKLLKDVSNESLDIDRELLQDVKCLANLATKYVHLRILNPLVQPIDNCDQTYNLISSIPWVSETISSTSSTGVTEEQIKYTKKFKINLDINNAVLNPSGSKKFCLVPDFQYCLAARLYFLKINLKCLNGDKISVKVPIVLQKEKN